MEEQQDALLTQTIACAGGREVAVGLLNLPKSLNALDRDLAISLADALRGWAGNRQIAAVVLGTTSMRAFCAGGDIRRIYEMMSAGDMAGADHYFADEYRLDRLLHKYPKPVLCWGTGIVMGGGMGVMQGCAVRVATETTRIAMPETLIGFFPDVGACNFLRNAPENSGLFLGLVGPRLNAQDAVAAGLADCILPSDSFDRLLQDLRAAHFTGSMQDDKELMLEILRGLEKSAGSLQDSQYLAAVGDIAACLREEDLAECLGRLSKSGNSWVAKAAKKAANCSPGAMALWWRYWRDGADLGIDDVLRRDQALAAALCRDGEFREGVRALIIDKGESPKWRHNSATEVDDAWLGRMESAQSSAALEFIDL